MHPATKVRFPPDMSIAVLWTEVALGIKVGLVVSNRLHVAGTLLVVVLRPHPANLPLSRATEDRRMLHKTSFPIDQIRIPVKRAKTLDVAKMTALAEAILEEGQLTPIRIRADRETFVLIEGLHRLEALMALGEVTVEGYLVQARLH